MSLRGESATSKQALREHAPRRSTAEVSVARRHERRQKRPRAVVSAKTRKSTPPVMEMARSDRYLAMQCTWRDDELMVK